MFVLRINFKKSRTLIIISLLVLTLIFATVAIVANTDFTSVKSYATCDEVGEYSLAAGNAEEQADFLEQFGYEVQAENAETDEITIPKSFNDTYEKYNELQKAIGLDLESYKGKSVQRVRLELSDGNYAVLLIFKDKVVGAHITSGVYGDENLPLV